MDYARMHNGPKFLTMPKPKSLFLIMPLSEILNLGGELYNRYLIIIILVVLLL